jgi:hypothetical protein
MSGSAILRCSLLLSLALAAGCANGFLDLDDLADYRKNADGTVTLLDTPAMWNDWVKLVDRRVTAELRNQLPPERLGSWDEYWVLMISRNRGNRENEQKYIDYIIDRRRTADLPPLSIETTTGDGV